MKAEGSTEKVNIQAIASELKTNTLTDEEVAGKLSTLFGITESTTYEELKTQTEDYMAKNPIPRKEANSLFGVLAASINGSKTYKCTAIDDKGAVLGTAVLTVTNRIIKGVGGGVTS